MRPASAAVLPARSRRAQSGGGNPLEDEKIAPGQEEPGAKAKRLTEKLCGLLKEKLAEYGGGKAFLRWFRSEDEEDAAHFKRKGLDARRVSTDDGSSNLQVKSAEPQPGTE